MPDAMDVSLAGAVLAPSGTSRVTATTVSPPAAAATTAPTAPASRSSVVTLSPQGQLASALGTLADTLKAAQANLASADPAALNTTAQDVSNAFNALLQNIGTLPTLLDTPSPLSLVAQFLQNLDATALTDTSGGTTLFSPALIPDTTATTTSALDTLGTLTSPELFQSLLQAANATAPAQTQALLAQTSQSLTTQIAAFEAQVVGSTQTSPSLLTAASLLTTDQTTATTPLTLLTQALATATTTTAVTTPSTATTPIAAANRGAAQAAPSTAANDAAAADQQASRAAQALQALLADPFARQQSLVKEPLYAALIANTHLSDFVPAAASLNPNALAGDVPAAVLPTARTRAIAYYGEQIEAEARGVERAIA
ncbi:hypothetical protein OTERR_13760 [Oryzomicrobium terrae]|uniref:Uncharacterized protein n=1 Tax=Oryzomicrobium terrae TaxID=1735038 RepID=A0A5C1E7D1_9RHOO|nr:hypothetical protein [Oryzomicrobium terrae]QEL64852.1 hypothetical protein OTERR_13760 [Oryzomicrobium terrae]